MSDTPERDPFQVMPSGLRLIDEMRRFAEGLSPDVGPMFGQDVVRVLNGLEARVKEQGEALRLAKEQTYCQICGKELSAVAESVLEEKTAPPGIYEDPAVREAIRQVTALSADTEAPK